MPVLDPKTHTISQIQLTVRDPNTPPTSPKMPAPSPYWGEEAIWTSKNNVHNPMLDEKGRLWLTSAVRPPENPAFCKEGSSHPSAKLFPIAAHRPAPGRCTTRRRKKLTHIGTCFGTHHLMFAEDANNTLWTSGGGQVVGWLNRKMFDETGDEAEVAGLDRADHGHQRQRQARRVRRARTSRSIRPRTSASARRSTPWRPRPTARSGAPCSVTPARSCGSCPDRIRRRRRSPKSTSRRSTIRRAPGLLAARRRRRSQRRVLVGAGERAPGELRSPQVQGPAERSEGHRPALPRGLDALHRAAAAVPRREGRRQRRRQLLHVGRSVRHARPRREHADQHRQRVGSAARAEGRQVGGAARAVSARASTRSGWTAASTIRRAAGRAAACGRPSARARRSTWRPARARRARCYHVQLRPDPLAK